MEYSGFFRSHPVFTVKDLSEYVASRRGAGERAVEAILAYHHRTGRLVRVRRGMYAVIPLGADSTTYPIDPFLIASQLAEDATVSHHSALEFHGRAYSIFEHLTYSASHPSQAQSFRGQRFQGTAFPRALVRAGKTQFGVITGERMGMPLSVTSLERTLVDVLDRPLISGGWEEIWRSLEMVEFFDTDVVVEYVLLLNNATTASKVGFFLEQHRDQLMIENNQLKCLQRLRPSQPHYMDRVKRTVGHLVANWNLVVPRDVFTRSWDEVL